MNLLQQIKEASIVARKQRSPISSFLITMYSESANVGKNLRNAESTDLEVIAVLKKFKDGAETIIKAANSRKNITDQALMDQANIEISIINEYLPVLISDEELTSIIVTFIQEESSATMGKIMSYLKTSFPGLYDGKVASILIKKNLPS